MERLHKVSAAFVFAFLCLHFANHFAGLLGVDAHLQFMDAARLIYRGPVIEGAVLLAFFVQILTGFALSLTIWREKKDIIHQLQAASGAYLSVFVILHVASIAVARMLLNLDTNFYFAASGFTDPAWKYVAYAFYGLAIFSLFIHMGCILYDIFKKTNKPVGWLLLIVTLGIGGYATYALLMMFSGQLYHVAIPNVYAHVFGQALNGH